MSSTLARNGETSSSLQPLRHERDTMNRHAYKGSGDEASHDSRLERQRRGEHRTHCRERDDPSDEVLSVSALPEDNRAGERENSEQARTRRDAGECLALHDVIPVREAQQRRTSDRSERDGCGGSHGAAQNPSRGNIPRAAM